MKPRIVKKLSKRLVEIAPSLFASAWVNNDVEFSTQHYAFQNNGALSSKQKRENLETLSGVNHIWSVGGDRDYWGEATDIYTVWEEWSSKWEWYGDFPTYPENHEFQHYPDTTGFRPTTPNLLKLAAEVERNQIGSST